MFQEKVLTFTKPMELAQTLETASKDAQMKLKPQSMLPVEAVQYVKWHPHLKRRLVIGVG